MPDTQLYNDHIIIVHPRFLQRVANSVNFERIMSMTAV